MSEEYEIKLMLDCGHIITVEIPDFVSVPAKRAEFDCPKCSEAKPNSPKRYVWMRGTPYKKSIGEPT